MSLLALEGHDDGFSGVHMSFSSEFGGVLVHTPSVHVATVLHVKRSLLPYSHWRPSVLHEASALGADDGQPLLGEPPSVFALRATPPQATTTAATTKEGARTGKSQSNDEATRKARRIRISHGPLCAATVLRSR